ncbi:MAG: two-component system response regulator [Chloroflexota bacterium]
MATENLLTVGSFPTVVVAENYPSARASLTELLHYDGYRVLPAANAEAALLCINSVANLAVLLADLDMDGWQSIVSHAATMTDAFIIAMAGNHPFSTMYNLAEYGIGLCFLKPVVYKDLRAAIRKRLGQTTGR